MFSKLKTLKKFNSETITIEQLVNIVRNNPQKDLIDKIRFVEYKSKEYNNLKLKVNCITPHGAFNSLCNNGLLKLSGYLYYDIDGFDTLNELNDTKRKLIDTGIVSFICKSVGGRGISFFVKINDTLSIPNDTFNDIYNYVRSMFIDSGFNIDMSANGLVRKMIISSDKDVYFNNEVSLGIDKASFQTFQTSLRRVKKVKKSRENMILQPNDTFKTIIPIEQLNEQIKIETLYTKEIDGDFIVEEMSYYKIFIPKIIKDGTKHKLYTRIINALYYINSNITPQQVYSYIHHINSKASPRMNILELRRLTEFITTSIETTGLVLIKPRVKRIHFSKENNLTKKQKQNMGAQLSANIKVNKTLKLIEEARMECAKRNEMPTQRRICEMTGLSIATIKRNWNKEYKDINNIKVNKDEINNEIQIEREYKLSQLIEEEDFWDGFTTEKKYTEKDIIDADFGESDGIDGLIESIDI